MNLSGQTPSRVLSGMRPTGRLHLGHYHGVIKQWVELQHVHDCYYFVADWHALTTEYENIVESDMNNNVWEMVIDWLASGVDPELATIFIQSRLPEHAELFLLLSMITPLGWLERVPSFKDQQQKLKNRDLSTFGFLGYPVLQSADILMYQASLVPVGADQVPHVELTREIARRFNNYFGKEVGFEQNVEAAVRKLGRRKARLYKNYRREYVEQGNEQSLTMGQKLVEGSHNVGRGDKERLLGHLEGTGRQILTEPSAFITEASKVPGLDGQKMSKSYGNAIYLRDDPDRITKRIRSMPTDPARVRRNDPGDPNKCPVWDFHRLYSTEETKTWVQNGCKSASIGCLDCKKTVIDEIVDEQKRHSERAKPYIEDRNFLSRVISQGCEKAADVASDTMREVRRSVSTSTYF